MRKNCKDVLEAWRAGKKKGSSDSIWTQFGVVYSYNTEILSRRYDSIVQKWIYFLNMTKYSVTTSRHQNAIYDYIMRNLRDDILIKFDDLPRNVRNIAQYYPSDDFNYTITMREAA